MTRGPTAPPPAAPLSYAALWALCDGARAQAESLAASYAADARAPKDPRDADFFRKRGEQNAVCARQFLALQKLIERCEQSAAIRAELKRLADAAAADAASADAAPAADEDDA